ncbi:MAG: ATP-binding protein, partial [Psychrosphaera sp.]|nr:ATP-binding protein [Psychrosphaera sp.]
MLVLSLALFCLAIMYLVGLGQSYLATIIKNIASNFFFPKSFDLDNFRKKHTHILGSTGSGKSSTIEFFIDQNIQKGQGFLLIEPHGELGQRVLHNKRFAPKHRSQAYQKLMYLDFDLSPPALNLFKLPLPKDDKIKAAFIDGLATELADAFCMNMKPTTTESQFMMLRNLLMAGFYIKGATFKELLYMLSPQNESLIKGAIAQFPSPALQQYFQSDYFSMSAKRTKEALRLRLTNLVIPQSLYSSLCANECSINFESMLAKNLYVIVKASAPLLGSYQAQTIGNII